jgi:uncharacterized membrane protein YraQ (UPF0718 family)
MRADPVFVPIAIALFAVALGLGFGLAPPRLQRVVGPLRTFALTAALAVAGTHLLPEAFSELGPSGVAVFALGLAFPSLTRLTRSFLAPRRDPSGRDGALEFGYLGLLVHHVADGMGLGAYGGATGHVDLDVLLALAVHTVPLVAVVTLAYRAKSGVRAACLRSLGLALASIVGVVASASVSHEASEHFSAWVAAGVAGLLVHVVTHDLERDLPSGTGARLLDLAAALFGVLVTVGASAMGHEPHDAASHGHEPIDVASGMSRLGEIVCYLAPPILLGLGVAAAFEVGFRGKAGSPLSPLSLARAIRLREEPVLAAPLGFKSGFLALLLASAIGFDALALGIWLAGIGLEVVRVFLVVALALVGASLFGTGRASVVPLEPGRAGSGVRVFADLVARTSPWLVTSVVLAAMLDATLEANSLAHAASPMVMALIVIALALPVQVDAVAAAPVLAVLVSKGMPAAVAVAAWVVVAAPGERGLLAIASEHRHRSVFVALFATAGIGFASLLVVSALPFHWSAPQLPPAMERVGQLSALVLAIPVLAAIWKGGLRGWFSPVFLHDHEHGGGEHHHREHDAHHH